MKQKNKSKRPKNLSRWVYFAHESDLSGAELFLGVNASYLQKVRAIEEVKSQKSRIQK